MAGAAVEVGGLRGVAVARARGDRGDLGGLGDLRQREPELRADVARVAGAGQLRPRGLALGEGRHRHLDQQHGAVAERERARARGREQDEPLGVLVERAQERGALGGLEALEPVAAQQPALEGAAQRGVGHHLRLRELAHVGEQQRPVGGARHERGGVRPGDDERQVGGGGEEGRDLGDRLLAARALGRHRLAPQAAAAERVQGRAQPEQEGGQRVGDLDGAVAERRRALALDQAQRARAPQRAAMPEAGEHVGGGDAVAHEQLGDQPRAREAARDVVVQVGEQPAVAGVQLRRRAEPEHRGVEGVQPEPRAGVGEPRVGVLRLRVRREGERLVVGDVEPAQRVAGVRVPRGRALDVGSQPSVEEREADGRSGLSRRARGRRHPPRPRVARPGSRPAADR